MEITNNPTRAVHINQKKRVLLDPQLKVVLMVRMNQKAPKIMVGTGEVVFFCMKTSL